MRRTSTGCRAATDQKPSLRWLRTSCALAFVSQFVVLEFWVRDTDFYVREPRYLGALLASLALMSVVLRSALARQQWSRIAVATLTSSVLVIQLAYFRYYHGPVDAQAVLAARHAWADVAPVVKRGGIEIGLCFLAVLALEYCLLRHGTSESSRQGNGVRSCVVALGLLVAGNVRGMTSEFRAGSAVLALCTTRAPRLLNGRLPLSEIESTRSKLPNVLFVITESVRASDACQSRGCATSPELDGLLPRRVSFDNARALSSYTAVALSALATGQLQLGPRLALSHAPDVFDLAHAARASGSQYTLAYWSSQLAGVFERGPIEQVADEVVTAETLMQRKASDIEDSVAALLDRRIAEHCEQRLARLPAPRFIVLHLSGTHAPYAFDDAQAPLKPWQRHVTWSGLTGLHRAYLNAIIEQDRSIGRCVASFLAHTGDQPWLVVYTSDHGEAFGEHSAIHHGQNLYDEQIRVPLLMSEGNGALTAEQARELERNRSRQVTHLDLVPTLLDVLGLRHHIALRAWAEKLPGRSLLSPLAMLDPTPITNCTELFPCPINTWGVLAERHKLTAQSWDGQWRCMALTGSESEVDLAACSELRRVACRQFRSMPNSRPDPFCAQLR